MKFIDICAGIGGFRLGLEKAGHEGIGFCEIDKYATKSYKAMHNTKGEWYANDVTGIKPEDLPEADMYVFGFPCQSFSIAGKRGGFNDTRGTIFFEIMRLVKKRKPRILLAENVKGLFSHDKGRTFETIIRTMDELGYDVEWQLLNSKDYGVPQNRERVFIIGHLRGHSRGKVFPIRESSQKTDELQGQEVNTLTVRYEGIGNGSYVIENKQPTQERKVRQIGNIIDDSNSNFKNKQAGRIYDPNGLSPTLNTMQGGGLEPKILQKGRGNNKGGTKEIAPTLTSNSWQENNLLLDENTRIRKLTPKECFRLQGFSDELFEKARAVNSDSQLYKQAGNSVTVNVVYEIGKRLKEITE